VPFSNHGAINGEHNVNVFCVIKSNVKTKFLHKNRLAKLREETLRNVEIKEGQV